MNVNAPGALAVVAIRILALAVTILGAARPGIAAAQTAADPPALYVIFDASGSMWGQLPDRSHKVTVARAVLQDFFAQDFGDAHLAFRAYGHRREGDCRDSELVVPFSPATESVARVRSFLEGLNPLGKTPIAYSLQEARADFGDREGQIILITDGIENCDPDPCTLVAEWRAAAVPIQVHVVGFGVRSEERAGLECIATASGTDYIDAESGADLAAGLSTASAEAARSSVAVGEPDEFDVATTVGVWLQGLDEEGEPIRVEGILSQDGSPRFEVSSNARNQVTSGDYDLLVGVATVDGTLYRPVARRVTIAAGDDTTLEIDVVTPPSVRATFAEDEEERRGAQIRVYQEGVEVFTFRWMDEVFLAEGTYEFRTSPNADNDLSLTETVGPGDHKELVFALVSTVHATFRMIAEGSATPLRGNYELWQGGELRYRVHTANGATVLPGSYEVRLDNDLTPHRAPDIVVGPDPERQVIEIEVPVAHVTFIYQTSDGARDADKRVFLSRAEGGRTVTVESGQVHVLTPGLYRARGWRGDYAEQIIEVRAGEDREIVLRAL